MPILLIFAPFINWIFRAVVIKFVVLTAVFAVLAVVIPKAIELISPHIGLGGLSGSFSSLNSGVWWWLQFFSLEYGLPLCISAFVARFLIRRLPFIG